MLRQPRPLVPFTFPFAGQSYARRILNMQSAALIADWQLGETTGSNAANAEGTSARDGSYVGGVTLNADTFSDGSPAPSFNGSTSLVNIYSSSLNSAFNGSAGTLAGWIKLPGAAWTDGMLRRAAFLQVNSNNLIRINKGSNNNTLQWAYTAGGALQSINVVSLSLTSWIHVAMTWNKAADQMIAYLNGSQAGTTQTGLGSWTGSLLSTGTVLGSGASTASNVWSGNLAYMALWSVALSGSEIAALAAV